MDVNHTANMHQNHPDRKGTVNFGNFYTPEHLVSVGRRITKNKGTMLSEKDWLAIDKYNSDIALVMYRMVDDSELGWGGPIWMPNIKLPEGFVFYKMD